MDPFIYKIIHYVGIFTLLFALGSLFTKYNKCAVVMHGIALFLMILGGFGMQAKFKAGYIGTYGSAWPNWLIAKIVIWLIFGAAVVLAKRKIIQGPSAFVLMIGLATCAAYLALFKPF